MAAVISSAVLSGSVMTVAVTGAGAKTTAAPLKFQPFTTTTNGQKAPAVGLDQGYSGPEAVVMSDGVGGGSIRFTMAPGNGFPHMGYFLPSNPDSIYVSCWLKLYSMFPSSEPALGLQVKSFRLGVKAVSNDPSDNYHTSPHYACSLFLAAADAHLPIESEGGNANQVRWNEPDGTQTNVYTYPPAVVEFDDWVHIDGWFVMNTVGSANGVMKNSIKNKPHVNQTDCQPRDSSSQHFEHIQLVLAIDEFNTPGCWDYAMSRIHVDTTQQRVFLGDASTFSACTGQFVLPASVWPAAGNGNITTAAVNIPAGFNWVYVVDAAGAVNTNGVAYSAAGTAPVPVFQHHYRNQGVA